MQSFPPPFFLIQKNEQWFVEDNNKKQLLFYSHRSLARECKLIQRRLKDLPADKTLLVVSPFVDALAEQLCLPLMQKKFIWFSPFQQTSVNKRNNDCSCCLLLESDWQWKEFLYDLKGNEKFEIFVHPLLVKFTSFAYARWIVWQMQEGALRLKTIFHFEKIWQKNFSQNLSLWLQAKDISLLPPPDVLLLAGPRAENFFADVCDRTNIVQKQNLWVADTCAGLCLQRGIMPTVVFSIDGGNASYKHFFFSLFEEKYKEIFLVMDLLSLPQIVRKNFKQKFSYQSQYPLWQKTRQEKKITNNFHSIENAQANVGTLMIETAKQFFPHVAYKIYGYDQGHVHFDTHVRGSAYHKKQYCEMNRLKSCEQYFYRLAKSYYPAKNNFRAPSIRRL